MANIKATKTLCDQHGVPLLIDAARFAENAWFIRMREQGFGDKSPKEIAQEMFSYSDGAMMSMKKDAFGNIGGLISLNSNEWVEQIRSMLILTEGFPTYGGLAGRDMAALAVGLKEILEPDYLSYRIRSTAYVGEKLDAAGVPTLKPFGGHAIYLDGRSFCAHLSDEQLPAWSLSAALYVKSGVRTCEIGNVMFGRLLADGGFEWPSKDLVRLAIPRRVYTQSHMDFVIEEIISLYNDREQIKGLRFRHRPTQLPHFSATFETIE
jgi:tryptophanase